jgi:hypothetical protein
MNVIKYKNKQKEWHTATKPLKSFLKQPVLGIHCHFGADLYLLLTDPDPTPFFSYFEDAKKYIFFIFYNLSAGTLSSA